VVEGARLESVYTRKGIAGSNPALSAKSPRYLSGGFFLSCCIAEVQYISVNFKAAVTLFGKPDYEAN
jgi:hypothetical protein